MNQAVKILIAVCLVLIVVLSFLDWQSHLFSRLKNSLSPKQENFTELYFENHLALPKTASPGANLSFSFTVHNLEHQPLNYPIAISIIEDQPSQKVIPLGDTNFDLAPDESKTTDVSLPIPPITTLRAQVLVKLMNLDQSIHFWVNIPAQATLEAQLAQQPPVATPSPLPSSEPATGTRSGVLIAP